MRKLTEADLEASPENLREGLLGNVRNDPKKRRYTKHRGENRAVARGYGQDLADVLKMRFVQGHTYEEIQKLTGLSRIMVMQMIEPFATLMADPEKVKAFKLNEAHILDGVRMLMVQGMVDQLTDEKRRMKTDLNRLTFGYGVLYDKARLERDQSTANVAMTLSDLVRAAHAKGLEDEEPAVIVESTDAASTA